MNEETNYPMIDPELEARIVAFVLGEASDFERDQLGRLIEDRPELAAFKQQIESVHAKLCNVGRTDSPAEGEAWKLPAEKRSAVLDVISGDVSVQASLPLMNRTNDTPKGIRTSLIRRLASVAAVFCVLGCFGLLVIPSMSRSMTNARMTDLSAGVKNSFDDDVIAEPAPAGATIIMSDAAVTLDERLSRSVEPSGVAEHDYAVDSKSSLWGIRESLATEKKAPSPYYAEDEVRYQSVNPDTSPDRFAESNLSRPTAPMGGPASVNRESTRRYDGEPVMPKVENYTFDAPDSPTASSATSSEGMVMDAISSGNGRDEAKYARQSERPAGSSVLGRGKIGKESAQKPFGKDESAAAITLAPQTEPLSGGTNLHYSNDPQVAGQKFDIDQNGNGAADSVWIDPGLALSQQDSGSAQSNFSRHGQLGAGIGGSRISGNEIVADSSRFGNFDDFALPAITAPVPTNEPMSSGEPLRKLRDIQDSTADKEAELNESVAVPGGSKWVELRNPSTKNKSLFGHDLIGDPYGADVDLDKDGIDLNENAERGRPAVAVGKAIEVLSKPARIRRATKAAPTTGLDEKSAEKESFSTFSLHVSDVSFKLAQAALSRGEWPAPAKVRIEEFVNAFDYGDPMPCESEKVACRVEQSIHPFLQQRNVMRVAMRTAAAGRASTTPLRLTFLVDNSGSMERIDRQQTVRRAFALLAGQLKPIDQVSLISFARQPRLLADKVSGAQSAELFGLINSLPSEGGTNIEAAIQLAFEKAKEQQLDGAQNRIVLLTDGAVNLGDANPERLSQMIGNIRDAGIAFDAAGISAEGLNDEVLEALTRKGDGRYYLLDSLEAIDDGFARQIAGALRPSAKNVKVQVEFNPKRVGHYKLLGFEKHLLKKEDFRNDRVDAAEMAAAEAGVAVYQFEAKPDGEGDIGSVSVRFRDLSTGLMVENRWPIPYQADALRPDQAAPALRIATSAALLAARLRGEPLGETVDLITLSDLVSGLPDRERNAKRVQQLRQMIEQARQISGN